MQTSKKISEKNNKDSAKALATATATLTRTHHSNQQTHAHLEQILQALASQLPNNPNQTEQLKICQQIIEQLHNFQQHSQILIAIIEPTTLNIKYANKAFWQLIDSQIEPTNNWFVEPNIKLNELFTDWNNTEIAQLYRLHLLYRVLKQLDQIETHHLQIPSQTVISTINQPPDSESHYIEFWLSSEQLKITRIDTTIDEFADLNLKSMSAPDREAWLIQPGNLEILANQLQLENYQTEGLLLLEGLDVTANEKMRRLTQLLIERESLMQLEKFQQVYQDLRSLFRCDNMILLRNEGNKQLKLFIGSEYLKTSHYPTIYNVDSLEDSPVLKTASDDRIKNIPDLQLNSQTQCEQHLCQIGVRSLLLIPLKIQPTSIHDESGVEEILGIVGLTSDRPNNFNTLDYKHALELTPAFIAAVRQTIQQRFTNIRNIHPAVEWRFLQEAKRRSWGLPPETIIFEDVYPLYGICDIRGSSTERNKAIQADLLEQFRLGLAIVEAVCQSVDSAFSRQLRQDMQEYIQSLEERVTVDIEITAIDYLHRHLEVYFDYFVECGDTVKAAVEDYRLACDNQHGCVYLARESYDRMLQKINYHLQRTWESWQERMQKIMPHHCDFEATDGIDHMIYVGRSINSKFSQFHLCSLRYEQLRAICDCARTALRLQAESEEIVLSVVHLVLVQNGTIDIYHNESTERLFDVKGTRDIRYEIVKKRIDKGVDKDTKERITQPGMLTVVYSTDEEWQEYRQYFRYLVRDGWVEDKFEAGLVEPLQGVSGLRFLRVKVLLASEDKSICGVAQ